jgi:large subunit ribosomal protein L18
MKQTIRSEARIRRHERIRRVVRGTAARPRMCVHVSNRHIQVQFVDDDKGVTLAAVSTLGATAVGRKSVDGAKEIGRKAAEAAQGKGIAAVVFDRGGFAFHGRVKAIADAARAAGLKF